MMRIGVFCGSASGNSPIYIEKTKQMGHFLADSGVGIVYGGGKVGLMGEIANSALSHRGAVIGVMPRALVEKEIVHQGLTELHVVENMHERKSKMAELSDAFIALPGGAGTFEEIFEQWTWAQLGIHEKPCAFLNIAGYFDPLRDMIRSMVDAGFLRSNYADMLLFSESPEELLTFFHTYQPPEKKWTQK
ncbi:MULTISPECIES: TIGR00730 family Rossman fold protein [Pectobacterium]|uniref:LOG family protein n=1 Tax=Pectobacterium TaxID=122277 RepID=UPI0015DE26B4|nr:TIGR00730 family Rossman fold protein [Pectobacterium sp. CFBP8739]